jgi:hypothetical protein
MRTPAKTARPPRTTVPAPLLSVPDGAGEAVALVLLLEDPVGFVWLLVVVVAPLEEGEEDVVDWMVLVVVLSLLATM